MLTVSDLYLDKKINFARGRYNILDCGIRTGKTYWAIHYLKDFTRDNDCRRILFLTDTTALKETLIEQYPDQCCEVDTIWAHSDSSLGTHDDVSDKIGVMCYQALGMRVVKDDLDFLNAIDVICWDECDSIFDFAASAFARARKFDFARKDSTNGEILNLIQQHSTNKEYMPLILLGFWERIINENRVLCVGLSATPERAKAYYDSLVSMSYRGKIDSGFRAAADIYYKNIHDHIKELHPVPGIGYWVYSPSIEVNKGIVRAANEHGFHAIEIHSKNNADKPLDPEQLRVIDCIENLHMVPYEYDFVVVTRAFERGIDIIDPRFKNLIVDSYYQTDRIQAARQTFPYQRHVKTYSQAVPVEFMNRWITLDEGRQLAEYMSVPDIDAANKMRSTDAVTWNKLQTILPSMGYTVEKKRRRVTGMPNPLTCYRITGEWHDIEIKQEPGFMELVAAKTEQQIEEDEQLI